MTVVVWTLATVVVVLAVLVLGLLRSHAVIVRALHEMGVDLDPDRADESVPTPLTLVPNPGRTSGAGTGRSSEPLISGADLDLRTEPGVPGPADVSGQRGHDIVGELPTGGARTVSIRGRQSTLIAFLSTGCGTCASFWNELGRGVALPADTRLVIVTRSGESESPADVAALAPPGVVTVMSSVAWDDYGVPVAPYFVLVDGASGVVIGEGAAHGWALVEAMLARAVADADRERTVRAAQGSVSRRDALMGRNRHRHVDAALAAAGLEPGDPRLRHASPHEHESIAGTGGFGLAGGSGEAS